MRKISCVILLVCMMLSISTAFSACGNKKDSDLGQTEPGTQKNEQDKDSLKEQKKPLDSLSFPITDKPLKLTWWGENGAHKYHESLDDFVIYKKLQEITGIDIEFIHPPLGQGDEQFSLLIASGEYPDLIMFNFLNKYPGGIEKAIEDKVIISLNDLINNYSPNLRDYLKSNEELAKVVRTNDGLYYCYPSLLPDPTTRSYIGPFVREDWLEELNIEKPHTIDEWYRAMVKIKESGKSEFPLSFLYSLLRTDVFAGAYDVGLNFYMRDGKVYYGPLQPQFKDFISTIRKWYAEGLIDPDFATFDRKTYEAKVLKEENVLFVDYLSRIAQFTSGIKSNNPDSACELSPINYPVLKRGEKAMLGHFTPAFRPFVSIYITTANKYPEESAMMLDYAYSEEGNMLFNFGVEGQTYNMVNGFPTYTKDIADPETGKINIAGQASISGPFKTDPRFFVQQLILDQQKQAIRLWSDTDVLEHQLPPISPTAEDSKEFANIYGEIETYVSEMILKFILGQESTDKFDDFVNQIKSMGIDRVIEIKQTALDSFNSR